MRRKHIVIASICVAVFILLIGLVLGANALLTNIIESSNIVCKDQKFSTVEDAIHAMEITERENNDTSLDYCPPYEVMNTYEYEDNTIVFYSYCYSFDGKKSTSYAVRILKHNDDGTLSFDSGFADFHLNEPTTGENYYYYTNINTSKGNRSISFLYLPKDSEKEIYVDGIKAEKVIVSMRNEVFYLCYAISARDTFLSNLFTEISDRHTIEIKK